MHCSKAGLYHTGCCACVVGVDAGHLSHGSHTYHCDVVSVIEIFSHRTFSVQKIHLPLAGLSASIVLSVNKLFLIDSIVHRVEMIAVSCITASCWNVKLSSTLVRR